MGYTRPWVYPGRAVRNIEDEILIVASNEHTKVTFSGHFALGAGDFWDMEIFT